MADKNILHIITPLKHPSPFDVNMATEAGYDVIASYANVWLGEITGLVQEAVFSRSAKTSPRTAIFIDGSDAILALDMLDAAKKTVAPPFDISIFADPGGSFTTAAAMVACAEKALREKKKRDLKDLKIAIFGATGVVGFASAAIAALEGARVTLAGHDGVERVSRIAREIKSRFNADVESADGSDETKKMGIAQAAEAVFCVGSAGVQILSKAQIAGAPSLLIAADVNAEPPAGVEGLDLFANGTAINSGHVLGVGPLAIRDIKYKTKSTLFRRMAEAAKPGRFDFRDAFVLARELNG